MDLAREEILRKNFRKLLFELADDKNQDIPEDEDKRNTFYCRLEELYLGPDGEKQFRHYYSDIFATVTEVQKNAKLGDINILVQNLDFLLKKYEPKVNAAGGTIDILDELRKLYDHVNLDVAQLSYTEFKDEEAMSEVVRRDIKADIDMLQGDVKSAADELDNVKKSLQDSQKNYVTILGIFAAIVLAFTGGLAFSTSLFENLHNSNIYRIVLISLIVGLILFNTLYILFCYLDKILFKKEPKKYFVFLFVNILLLLLMFINILAWHFGWVENRDERIAGVPNMISITNGTNETK